MSESIQPAQSQPRKPIVDTDKSPAPENDSFAEDGSELTMARPAPGATPPSEIPDANVPLFPADRSGQLTREWDRVQAGFVDEPRRALQQADALVAETIEDLSERFSAARARLETKWERGNDVSTEDLRLALQQCRSFFRRLLSV